MAGYPQRHTKAPCRTPQGASLIQDSACLQEQPQELENRTTLTIACSHFILSFLMLLYPCKLCLFSFFEYKIPVCYLFLSTHFSVVLPVSSIIIFSPSYILTQAHLSSSRFPSQFLIFLYNTVCQPFALRIKIFPIPVIIHLWQLGRTLCVWRYADLLFGEAVFAQTDTG